MNCPNCGTPEQARVRVCPHCGIAYASQDLLELRQLEYLLQATAAWPGTEGLRQQYAERLEALRARLLPPELTTEAIVTAQPAAAPEPMAPPPAQVEPPVPAIAPALVLPAAQPAEEVPAPQPAPPPKPKAEAVPFDQWLLSERNIKIALYSGGALLVLSGLIFVGVNWARLPGPAKFAITFLITGLMYLGGYLLYQRPTLKLGGVAVLGVASGFVPLNFVVLQVYIFGPRGLSADAMWLTGSLFTLLLYALTAYWTRADLFTYLSLAALASGLAAALVLLEAPWLAFALAYALLALAILLAARLLQPTRLASFTRTPLLIVSQVAMPVIFIASGGLWVSEIGCQRCASGSPWLAIAAMLTGVVFYVVTDITFGWPVARWVAAFAFALTVMFTLVELDLSSTAIGTSLLVLALAYLLIGYAIEKQAGKRLAAWPLYAAGYVIASFVTILALADYYQDPDALAKTLLVDVILLAVSAWVHRQYEWVYGAAWLFIAPVYIYASLYLKGLSNQGLVLSVLMLNYVAAGYVLGRRSLKLGGPFLTAAAFLSVAVVALSWENAAVASIALAFIAVLYLFAALWLKWSWLLLPALAAVNIAVVSILRIFFTAESPWESSLTIIYASLGAALLVGGALLSRTGQKEWGWPLYLIGALDVAGSYIAAVYLGGPVAVGLSLVFALLSFWLAWVEQALFARLKLPPLLTYLGIALVFIGHFYVLDLAGRLEEGWTIYTAGLCAVFIVLAWFLRREPVKVLYGIPLRWAGLLLMVLPMAGAVYYIIFEPMVGAVTFAIAGITYAADATVRRILRMGYLAVGAFIVVFWAILLYFEVGELQAYLIPLGLGLLGLGWTERLKGSQALYRWPTLLGLLILMGSAFYQSIDNVIYAVLLLVESLAALVWGLRTHSRGYVQLGVLALVANAIAQLGPGFVELSRWIQLGIIGGILLGGGLIALFQREKLLASRKRLTDNWRQWQA